MLTKNMVFIFEPIIFEFVFVFFLFLNQIDSYLYSVLIFGPKRFVFVFGFIVEPNMFEFIFGFIFEPNLFVFVFVFCFFCTEYIQICICFLLFN